jgi:hypothetical protein
MGSKGNNAMSSISMLRMVLVRFHEKVRTGTIKVCVLRPTLDIQGEGIRGSRNVEGIELMDDMRHWLIN